MLKMIGLVAAASEVILRPPEGIFETKRFVGREATGGPPQELAALGIMV